VVYEFATLEKDRIVRLGSEYITIETENYVRWEEFRQNIESVLDKLVRVYPLTHFLQAGLRYRNLIVQDEIEVPNRSWRNLLNKEILGSMASEYLAEDAIMNYQSGLSVQIDPNSFLNMFVGLAKHQNDESKRAVFIDSEFYTDLKINAEVQNVVSFLNGFHEKAGRLFRWAISDELHAALGPQPVAKDSGT
jgi:uncharacterized protein (TIGR04255 family)